jgi:hypothetical protein
VSLTKLELQSIRAYLERYSLGQFGKPLLPSELSEVAGLARRVETAVETAKPSFEKGRLVLSWRLPKEWAPSLNSYAFMKGWQRTALRHALDSSLLHLLSVDGEAPLYGAQKKRWVRVTRFTSSSIDDLGVDVLGGKMPIDALVRGQVLVDDNQQWCVREGLCVKTRRGNTHVLVEVFEIVTEGGHDPLPRDGEAPKVPERKKRIIDE